MTVGNLAVCFGPTLLRPEEETVASIMDIKFYNIVVEILIENCEIIIAGPPQDILRTTQMIQSMVTSKVMTEADDGPTTSGNGTSLLRYPVHSSVSIPHTHVSSFSYIYLLKIMEDIYILIYNYLCSMLQDLTTMDP